MTHSRPRAQASRFQALLASALRGDCPPWPRDWSAEDGGALVEAALYHGVAGLLVEKTASLEGWPELVVHALRDQARLQAMWELRHREVLTELLAEFARQGIKAILMKGTALAYDLYGNPSSRSRADSDILVAPDDRNRARMVLQDLGYRGGTQAMQLPDDLARQEGWTLVSEGGGEHSIDLHWRVFNAPALDDVLDFEECAAQARPLPRLSAEALAMDRVQTLLHICVHRTLHRTAPYFVGGMAYFGSERLIWTNDIHLLAGALSKDEWESFAAIAADKGVAAACLEGLGAAQLALATTVPEGVLQSLMASRKSTTATAYLAHGRALPRSWLDFRAVPGIGAKLRYLQARLAPGGKLLRAKYPQMARLPLPLLYVRRLIGLVRGRAGAAGN